MSEGEPKSIEIALNFPNEESALRAFREVSQYVKVHHIRDISVFNLVAERSHPVVVLANQLTDSSEQDLRRLISSGEPIELPKSLGLLWERHARRRNERFSVQSSYRPGLPLTYS